MAEPAGDISRATSDTDRLSVVGAEGIVYLLTNAAMPGFVKIGFTKKNDIGIRVKGLDNTSLPLPFECYFAARVPDCRKLESTLHFVFGEKRARLKREFFTVQPDLAKAIIELVALETVSLTDAQQAISKEQRSAINETKARAERRTFDKLGIRVGTKLTFSKDPEIICTVSSPTRVKFDGVEMSISAAAMKVIRKMGYTWPAVSGFDYWQKDGVKLSAISRSSDGATLTDD